MMSQIEQDDWITHREAARILHVSEWQMRARAGAGFRYFPHLARMQPGGMGTRIYMFRSQVEGHKRQIELEALNQSKPHQTIPLVDYIPDETLEWLKRSNHTGVLRVLGRIG